MHVYRYNSDMDYRQALKENSIRVTSARISILDVLNTASKPVDISYIYEYLKDMCDEATVYRSIELLVSKGLVRKIDFREGKYRYELDDDHHHHVVCKECGTIEELEDTTNCTMEKLEQRIAKEHRYTSVQHSLEFFGVCGACQ